MAFLMTSFEVQDFDAWKHLFDSDPGGRTQAATGYQVFRAVENPNHVFVGTQFASADHAKAFRERLLASGAMENAVKLHVAPTVAELADEARY